MGVNMRRLGPVTIDMTVPASTKKWKNKFFDELRQVYIDLKSRLA
jgi:hypothetical protein